MLDRREALGEGRVVASKEDFPRPEEACADGRGGVSLGGMSRGAMNRRSVEVVVAGQKVKVVSSAEESELRALAALVTRKVEMVSPKGRATTPQALVLAALSLAHDLEEERARREALERKTRDSVRRMLVRVDHVLEELPDGRTRA